MDPGGGAGGDEECSGGRLTLPPTPYPSCGWLCFRRLVTIRSNSVRSTRMETWCLVCKKLSQATFGLTETSEHTTLFARDTSIKRSSRAVNLPRERTLVTKSTASQADGSRVGSRNVPTSFIGGRLAGSLGRGLISPDSLAGMEFDSPALRLNLNKNPSSYRGMGRGHTAKRGLPVPFFEMCSTGSTRYAQQLQKPKTLLFCYRCTTCAYPVVAVGNCHYQ